MAEVLALGAELAAATAGGWPWRPRRVLACEGGLVIVRAASEAVPWASIDAVIGGARVAIHARGRVLARLPDADATERLIAIVVERAGLVWLPASARRRGPPAMAVRPAVAARLAEPSPD